MKPQLRDLVLVSVVVGGLATTAVAESIAATYDCERGVTVPVVYVNGPDMPSVAVLYVEGRLITLEQAVSGSGARYTWPSDGSSYIWWEHQGTATLSWKDGATGDETPIYARCLPQG